MSESMNPGTSPETAPTPTTTEYNELLHELHNLRKLELIAVVAEVYPLPDRTDIKMGKWSRDRLIAYLLDKESPSARP